MGLSWKALIVLRQKHNFLTEYVVQSAIKPDVLKHNQYIESTQSMTTSKVKICHIPFLQTLLKFYIICILAMIFVLEEFDLHPIKVCITNSMKTEPFRLNVELLCICHAFDRPDLVRGEVEQPLWVCRGCIVPQG